MKAVVALSQWPKLEVHVVRSISQRIGRGNALLDQIRITTLFVLPLLATSALSAEPELVLREGARFTATTKSGTIAVIAGPGFNRTYEWNGCSLRAAMGARSKRWYGALGIYDAAGSFGLFDWLIGCKGISRTVVEEAQVHFSTQQGAERWMMSRSKAFDSVWSNDGLFIQWGVSPGRNQINADVWQICIAGKWPVQLRGAKDEAISVTQLSSSGSTRYECAPVGEEAMIDISAKP